jgi:hypothetical protein
MKSVIDDKLTSNEAKEPIELHTHFTFDCDECGAENFVRGFCADLAIPDTAQQHIPITQGDHDLKILVVVAPKNVTCGTCGASGPAVVCGSIDKLVDNDQDD